MAMLTGQYSKFDPNNPAGLQPGVPTAGMAGGVGMGASPTWQADPGVNYRSIDNPDKSTMPEGLASDQQSQWGYQHPTQIHQYAPATFPGMGGGAPAPQAGMAGGYSQQSPTVSPSASWGPGGGDPRRAAMQQNYAQQMPQQQRSMPMQGYGSSYGGSGGYGQSQYGGGYSSGYGNYGGGGNYRPQNYGYSQQGQQGGWGQSYGGGGSQYGGQGQGGYGGYQSYSPAPQRGYPPQSQGRAYGPPQQQNPYRPQQQMQQQQYRPNYQPQNRAMSSSLTPRPEGNRSFQ